MDKDISKSDIITLAKEMNLEEITAIKILQDAARKSLKASEFIMQNLSFKIGELSKDFTIHVNTSITDNFKDTNSHNVNVNINNQGLVTVTFGDGRMITFYFTSPQTIYTLLTPFISSLTDINNVNYKTAKIIDEILDWAISFKE